MQIEGATVGATLEALCARTPELHPLIFNGADLQPYVRVMVNGHDVELGAGLKTPVGAEDAIAVFPPITGG